MGIKAISLIMALSLVGCTQGHCRRKTETPGVAMPVEAGDVSGAAAKMSDRTFVYKYDGSLQCGMGKAIAVEEMAKELNGISIFSSVKKRDGLMHIQVCGSITGMANVYEIPTKSLKQAEAKGFKKWSFE
ncbi:MAG: hypothetical protein HC883_06155 [Bdellovibrionaceae bacterium]|nr:hypothetical protein [Pseudobdellovibrionaceae bacterium]